MEANFLSAKNCSAQSCTITDIEAARVLSTPKTLTMFSPFLVSECCASDAANVLGLEIGAMSYWIKRFLKLGLLQITRYERRAGRSIKHYHASSESFFIPFRTIPADSLEMMQERLLEQTRAAMTRSQMAVILEHHPDAGIRVFGQEKRLRMDYVEGLRLEPLYSLELARPAVLERWEVLKLNFEDAKKFQIELSNLLERYKELGGSHQYLVNLRLAPYKHKN
jgi:hypothetical protein